MGKRLYHIKNETCFETLSPISAYWLGFIAADGYIVQKRNVVGIGLNKRDIKQLENLKGFIESNNPIYRNDEINSVSFSLRSKILKKDISKWLPDKSKEDKTQSLIKHIPDEFKSEFIAGYFDGDGSVFSYNKIRKYKEKVYDSIEHYVITNFNQRFLFQTYFL